MKVLKSFLRRIGWVYCRSAFDKVIFPGMFFRAGFPGQFYDSFPAMNCSFFSKKKIVMKIVVQTNMVSRDCQKENKAHATLQFGTWRSILRDQIL